MKKSSRAIKIGSILSAVRKERGLTQEQLSELINVSATHISTVENGGPCSFDVMLTICDGLGTRFDYVAYGNIRSNKADNLNDLASLCNDDDLDTLIALANHLISRHKN